MGLDQHLMIVRKDSSGKEEEYEMCYWSKKHNIQQWMERLWRKKTTTDLPFCCVDLYLTIEDLDALEQAYKNEEIEYSDYSYKTDLSEEEKAEEIEYIAITKEELKAGHKVYYTSSW